MTRRACLEEHSTVGVHPILVIFAIFAGSEAKMSSIERRLARFIANERIVVPVIWKLFLEQVLTPFCGQQLYFVLDYTPFGDDLTMVYLGLPVHSRVLPVAWAVMPAQTTWDEGQWDIVGRLWLLYILRRVHNRASLKRCLPFQKTDMGWRFALRF